MSDRINELVRLIRLASTTAEYAADHEAALTELATIARENAAEADKWRKVAAAAKAVVREAAGHRDRDVAVAVSALAAALAPLFPDGVVQDAQQAVTEQQDEPLADDYCCTEHDRCKERDKAECEWCMREAESAVLQDECPTCNGHGGGGGFDRNGSHTEGRYCEYPCPNCGKEANDE